ncbi:MAG: DUF2254 domain-containing protein [Myxococcaceae bacterium]
MNWPAHAGILRIRLREQGNRLGKSLLIGPALTVPAAALLAAALSKLDQRLPPGTLPPMLQLSPEAGIQLLGTLAGATITTVGVVFSLILVSLQLASGQFSPRVQRVIFRGPLANLVVGALVGVFTYCVVALVAVSPHSLGEEQVVPELTINVAVLFTLVAVGLLLVFLRRIADRQYVGRVIEDISRTTHEHVEELAREGTAVAVPPPDVTALGQPYVVRARREGWVQQICLQAVLAAVPPGSVVQLETRAGALLVRGLPLATVWPPPERPQPVERTVNRAVVVGDERTMQQDVDFGLRQLTDIALRALSPAVNDPTTAVDVVLHLASVMRTLLLVELPPRARRDRNGTVLLTPWDLDHDEYVRHAFDQLHRIVATHPHVAVVLVRSLRMCIETVEDAGRPALRTEVQRQLHLTLKGCERAGLLPEDIAMVHQAATRPRCPSGGRPAEPPAVLH